MSRTTDQHRTPLAAGVPGGAPPRSGLALVARQPIYGPAMAVSAYELLYQESSDAAHAAADMREATLRIVADAALEIGLDRLAGGLPVHINYPRELLLAETPLTVHPERTEARHGAPRTSCARPSPRARRLLASAQRSGAARRSGLREDRCVAADAGRSRPHRARAHAPRPRAHRAGSRDGRAVRALPADRIRGIPRRLPASAGNVRGPARTNQPSRDAAPHLGAAECKLLDASDREPGLAGPAALVPRSPLRQFQLLQPAAQGRIDPSGDRDARARQPAAARDAHRPAGLRQSADEPLPHRDVDRAAAR